MSNTILQNEAILVEINNEKGWLEVVDKKADQRWKHDPWRDSAGELQLKDTQSGKTLTMDLSQGGSIKVTKADGQEKATIVFDNLKDAGGNAVESASVRVTLALKGNEPQVDFVVEDVACNRPRFEFISLLYPARTFVLMSEVDDGYQAIPYNQGAIVPSGEFKVPLREDWHSWDDLTWQSAGLAWGTEGAYGDVFVYGWNALFMPWWGSVNGKSAFICVLDSDLDVQCNFCLNYNDQDDYNKKAQQSPHPRIGVCSPRFIPTKGEFGYARQFHYRFLPGGTHVEMAKHYRSLVQAEGRLITLKEKMRQNPNVERLFGAPILNIDGGYPWYTDYKSMMYTWNQLKDVVEDLHNQGLERAFVHTWGGYSKLPPRSYPFHPEWGTEEELRSVVNYIQDLGWLYASYHGYPANLPHDPYYDPGESTLSATGGIGGRWGGRCSATQLKYAQEDLPKIIKTTGQMADYTDMLTAGPLRECYHDGHGQVRKEDRKNRMAVLEYIRSLGLITGTEVTQGYNTNLVDYAKGMMYIGLRFFLLQHIHAPLFSLVFHDCMVSYDSTVGTSRRMEWSKELLECVAYGVQPIFSFNMPHYAGARQVIVESSRLVSPLLRETATQELVHHEYLANGYDIQRTRFAEGMQVTMNADSAPFTTDEGVQVPARGFVVEKNGRTVRKGAIETTARVVF